MIVVIAAQSQNGVIGYRGKIPWDIPEEKKWFRQQTMGSTVILGRKSWQEIGRPLPGRRTIVLSRDPFFCCPGCEKAASLEEALSLADGQNVYIAGGAGVYEQALPLADRLCLTRIEAFFQGDTHFPAVDWAQWKLVWERHRPGCPSWSVEIWDRIPTDKIILKKD